MAKFSRTQKHLNDPRKSDGHEELPADVLDHPTFVPRLSWKGGGRVPTKQVKIARSIAHAGSAMFFCDNSLFDDRLDPAVLKALLMGADRTAITAEVEAELRPWLATRQNHPLARALRRRSRAIRRPSSPGPAGQLALDYYVGLLTIRRHALEISRLRFEEKFGRPASEDDRTWLDGDVHKNLGERGMLLAKKPLSPIKTDEILVYSAVEFGLRTGRNTVILTRDADVEEQFAKLIWLLDTHYRGMLLARAYAANPSVLEVAPFPAYVARDQNFPFEPDGAEVLTRGGGGDLKHLLPTAFRFVSLECWSLVGDTFAKLVFGAEREMYDVLAVKNETGGLSTNALAGRNIHPWLMPLALKGDDRERAAIVNDKQLPVGQHGARLAMLDVLHALLSEERHRDFRAG